MSLALLSHYLLLNMFRMLVYSSSGACDLLWIYLMGLLLCNYRGFSISVFVYCLDEPHRNTNIHRTRYVITHTHDIRIYSGNIIRDTLHTRKRKNHRTPQQPIFKETRLLKQPHTSRLNTCH